MERSDLQPGDTPTVFTQVGARQIIDSMLRNPISNRILRTLLKEVSAFAVLAQLGDTAVSAQLAKRLVSGEIKVIPADHPAAAGQKQKVEPAQADKPSPKVLAASAQDPTQIKRALVEAVGVQGKIGDPQLYKFTGKEKDTGSGEILFPAANRSWISKFPCRRKIPPFFPGFGRWLPDR